MNVSAIFMTDEKGDVTANLVTPFSVVAPQPATISRSRGSVAQFSPFRDPNDPIGFMFNLGSLSSVQLKALRDATARRPNDPVSRALLQQIDREQQRRAEEARKEEERKKKGKKGAAKAPSSKGSEPIVQ
jgi:hypothetical protein